MSFKMRSVPYIPVLSLPRVDFQDSVRGAERLLKASWPGLHCWKEFHLDKKPQNNQQHPPQETLTSAGAAQQQGELQKLRGPLNNVLSCLHMQYHENVLH